MLGRGRILGAVGHDAQHGDLAQGRQVRRALDPLVEDLDDQQDSRHQASDEDDAQREHDHEFREARPVGHGFHLTDADADGLVERRGGVQVR